MSQYVVLSLGVLEKVKGIQNMRGDICHTERLSPCSDEYTAGLQGAFVLALH
jgi:hypothetical protein